MIVASFIPILITILMIITFAIIAVSTNKGSKFVSFIKIQWVLVGYGTILLLSVGIYFMIPHSGGPYESVSVKGIPDLFDAVHNGSLLDVDQKFIANKWEFDYGEEELEVQTNYSDMYSNGGTTYIQKREDSSNKVEVIYYRTPTILQGGMDITDQLPLTEIEFSPNQITVNKQAPVSLDFISYEKEFPFTQHTEKASEGGMGGPYLHRGKEIVLIRIPKQVTMEYESTMDVQFVGW